MWCSNRILSKEFFLFLKRIKKTAPHHLGIQTFLRIFIYCLPQRDDPNFLTVPISSSLCVNVWSRVTQPMRQGWKVGSRTGESGLQSRTKLSNKSFQYFLFKRIMGKAKGPTKHLNFTLTFLNEKYCGDTASENSWTYFGNINYFSSLNTLWRCSRPHWMGLGAAWAGGRCPCPWQGWNWMGFEVPSVVLYRMMQFL